ncbi:uncharacterized protein Z518_10843 [Rhinocladiella mackenziei CBS 650.93]|uniref:UTP23 sensor motif region domain-containing protein n=1 Tax=Rhinocladiella mackenziei CBS 650.93 TaxID=1442369 RepID=A0A0D2I9H8_9EURO|nr:uncharacterized protein Z518_10843 [Rhinocladiella mackenziei CBS 650.93]KIW99915.1 hypothetical protein Z518_10843 [Rhinocladiella mackenziei CBS 650.93]
MRARRSKKYRKIMSTYQMSFSFREPYQVLVDGNFLKACHTFHMPLQKYLENTLHGQCRIFVTRCTLGKIMREWEKEKEKQDGGDTQKRASKGPGRPEFLPPPTELPLRHCKHKNDAGEDIGVISEARCLLDLLAGQPHGNEQAKNKQHYILATAEADERERKGKGFIDVRERARIIPGVPIVYVKRSVMILEEMSGVTEAVRRKKEKEKFGEGLRGVGLGVKRKRDDNDDESDEDEKGLFDLVENKSAQPKIRGLKKAKGPNPLSVLKKRVKAQGRGQQRNGDSRGSGQEQDQESRRKKTRRKRGVKKSAGDDDGGGPGGEQKSEAGAPAGASEA